MVRANASGELKRRGLRRWALNEKAIILTDLDTRFHHQALRGTSVQEMLASAAPRGHSDSAFGLPAEP
jgi:hypothetical protein